MKEKEIKDVFELLAHETKAKAPSFEAVWNEAQQVKLKNVRRLKVLSIAASFLLPVVLGASILFQRSCEKGLDNQTNLALLEWKAPTDVLLDKTNFSLEKVFSQPTDQFLEWQVDEDDLLKNKIYNNE